MIKRKVIFSLVSLFFLLATVITATYAWYVNVQQDDFQSPNITGYSTAAYFAGGDGSAETPYQITNARHLYNLAWLQYLGEFNKAQENNATAFEQVYFVVENDIDCADSSGNPLVIPPIGTTKNPFIGNFDGNSKVISNVVVQNTMPEMHPSSVLELSNVSVVGFFGVIGKFEKMDNSTLTISSTINSVSEFYLNNISVKSSGETLVGVVAGYVGGNISKVGVHYCNIDLGNTTSKLSSTLGIATNNISSYALIGEYDPDIVKWDDVPGNDYGKSYDASQLKDRYSLIYQNNNLEDTSLRSPNLPLVNYDSSTDSYSIPSSQTNNIKHLPLLVSNEASESFYLNSDAKEVASDSNIGYIGKNTAAEEVDITFGSGENQVPMDLYIQTGQNPGEHRTLTTDEWKDMPQTIKDLFPSGEGQTKSYFTIKSTYRLQDGEDARTRNVSVKLGTNTYDNVIIPSSGIWFKPIKVGKIRVVVYAPEPSKSYSFHVYPLNRTSGTFAEGSDFNQSEPIDFIKNKALKGGRLFYFEYDITQADLDANIEYAIGTHEGTAANFLYLDIGTSSPTTPPEYQISDVDFVATTMYEDISSSNYTSSNVGFAISTSTSSSNDVIFYFRRKKYSKGEYTDVVLYYIDPRTLDSSNNPTNQANGLNLAQTGTGTSTAATSILCNNYPGGIDSTEVITNTTAAYNSLNTAVTAGTITNNADSLALINTLQVCLSEWESLDDTSSASITTAQIKELLTTATNQYGSAEIKSLIDKIGSNLTTSTITTSDEAAILSAYEALTDASADVKTLVGESYVSKCNSAYELLQSAYVTVTFHVENDTTQVKMLPTTALLESNAPMIDTELYDFNGWYSDSAFNTAYTFGNAVGSQNIDLYANVAQKTIVIFKLNGEEISRVTKSAGAALEAADFPSIDTELYYFNGWYDEGGNEYTIGSTVSGNVTLIAEVDNKYSVTFVYNNGASNSSTYANKDGIVTKPTDPTHSNATFVAWYSDEALTQEFNFETAISSNIKLYAKWAFISYEVTFNATDGTFGQSNTIVVNSSTETGLVAIPTNPTYDGHTFAGWYLDEQGSQAFDESTIITSDTILYAKWNEVQLVTKTIRYSRRGVNSSGSITYDNRDGDKKIGINDFTTLSEMIPEEVEGYEFVGWYIDWDMNTPLKAEDVASLYDNGWLVARYIEK